MALRSLQASLLAERDRVLASLDLKPYSLKPYSGPILPVVAAPKRTREIRDKRDAKTGAAASTPARRSSRVAGVSLDSGPEDGRGSSLDAIDNLAPARQRAPKEPRRAHNPRPLGVGELHVMLQLTKGSSDKFYEMQTEGSSCIVRNGRRGCAGVERILSFSDAAAAKNYFREQGGRKRYKGYYDGTDGSEEGAALVSLRR